MKKGTKKSLDFERLGVFYLGRLYDLKTRKGREADAIAATMRAIVRAAASIGKNM